MSMRREWAPLAGASFGAVAAGPAAAAGVAALAGAAAAGAEAAEGAGADAADEVLTPWADPGKLQPAKHPIVDSITDGGLMDPMMIGSQLPQSLC